ncbi:MAG: hypothetical protein ACREMM_09595 [Gemmatimonadales bacterium]
MIIVTLLAVQPFGGPLPERAEQADRQRRSRGGSAATACCIASACGGEDPLDEPPAGGREREQCDPAIGLAPVAGEPESTRALSLAIRQRYGWNVKIARDGECVDL